MKFEYNQLESELNDLLSSMKTFTHSEIAEVRQFISAGEYGIAFETFCGILDEENKCVPKEMKPTVRKLAEQMDIDPVWWKEIVEAERNP